METDAVPAGTQDGPHSQELAHASPSPMADGGKSDGYVPMMPDPADDAATWTSFPFVIKKFNPVFFWSWDVHSENCAICRVMLMEPCLNCQVNNKTSCVVVWGECNHSFHNCCMSAWIKNATNATSSSANANKCPLCQSEWVIQRVGK